MRLMNLTALAAVPLDEVGLPPYILYGIYIYCIYAYTAYPLNPAESPAISTLVSVRPLYHRRRSSLS